jgi:hypothetical protein
MIMNEEQPDSKQPDEPVQRRRRTANFGDVDYSHTQGGRLYANHAGANITLFDVQLILSNVEIDTVNNKMTANETLTVYMSAELAHIVHALLGQALANYTGTYGNLRLPSSAKQAEMPTSDQPKSE